MIYILLLSEDINHESSLAFFAYHVKSRLVLFYLSSTFYMCYYFWIILFRFAKPLIESGNKKIKSWRRIFQYVFWEIGFLKSFMELPRKCLVQHILSSEVAGGNPKNYEKVFRKAKIAGPTPAENCEHLPLIFFCFTFSVIRSPKC